MENKNIESFECYWDDFVTAVKGKVVKESANRDFGVGALNLIIRNARLDWESSYEGCGRWLNEYKKKNPEKGALIQEILLKDMMFSEIAPEKNKLKVLGYVLPVAGAATGFGISSWLGASRITKIISGAAPAVVLFAMGKVLEKNNKAALKKSLADKYMSQLDKYKNSVISVLSEKDLD